MPQKDDGWLEGLSSEPEWYLVVVKQFEETPDCEKRCVLCTASLMLNVHVVYGSRMRKVHTRLEISQGEHKKTKDRLFIVMPLAARCGPVLDMIISLCPCNLRAHL